MISGIFGDICTDFFLPRTREVSEKNCAQKIYLCMRVVEWPFPHTRESGSWDMLSQMML